MSDDPLIALVAVIVVIALVAGTVFATGWTLGIRG